MTISSYTRILLGAIVGILALVASFNFIINPFDLFPVPSINSLNRIKIETEHRQRLTKPYIVAKRKPDAVIIGTSRALQIDAHYPAFKPLHAYNLALASASAYENFRYIQDAEAVHKLKLIIYGLDAFAGGDGTYTGFSESRLTVSADNKQNKLLFLSRFKDYVPALLSFDAFRSSINTIGYQPPYKIKNPRRYMRALDRREMVKDVGQYRKFADIEASYLRGAIYTGYHPEKDSISVSDWEPKLASLRKIIRFSYMHNIKLIIFISPSHAHMMEVWRISGKWLDLENWKRAVVAINDDEATRAAKPPFSIWDFTGYNSITTEAVPAPGDHHTEMKWYSEASHYTMDTGDLILNRILDYHQSHQADPVDFGIKITRNTIERDLKIIRTDQIRYIQTHQKDVEDIKKLANEISQYNKK